MSLPFVGTRREGARLARQLSQSEHAMNKKLEEKRNKERLSKIVKLPENKKCFDCAGRGRTQYVVMPLWTFVCTGCSGVHREFSH